MFFGVFKQFNENKNLPIKLMNEIEQFLYYRWKNDRNVAFSGEESEMMVQQMPAEVFGSLLQDFLYTSFLTRHYRLFSFKNNQLRQKNAFYTWSDKRYVEFMTCLLSYLEPRMEKENVILLEENEEVNEILFFEKDQHQKTNSGSFCICYEINK